MAATDLLDALAASLEDRLEVNPDGDERVEILDQLARTFDKRFEITRQWDDRQAAINYTYETLAHLGEDDARRPEYVGTLAVMLFQLHGGSGRVAVEEAIEMGEWAYDLVSTGKIKSLAPIKILAELHGAKYREEDCVESLRRRIELMEQYALSHRELSAYIDASRAFFEGFERTGNLDDLEMSVRYAQSACLDSKYQDPSAVFTLCWALLKRYKATHSHNDLDDAIHAAETALQSLDLSAGQSASFTAVLSELKEMHSKRRTRLALSSTATESTDEQVDLRIKNLLNSIQSHPENSRVKRQQLMELGTVMGLRAVQSTALTESLELAISYTKEALSLCPTEDPLAGKINAFLAGYEQMKARRSTKPEDVERCQEASSGYSRSAGMVSSCAPADRIKWYSEAAMCSVRRELWSKASADLQHAVELLPLLSSHSNRFEDHEFVLKEFGSLSSYAASILLTAEWGQPDAPLHSLVLAERGRGTVARLLTSTRVDVSELAKKDPRLCKEYTETRKSTLGYIGMAPSVSQMRAAAREEGLITPGDEGEWSLGKEQGFNAVRGLVGHVDINKYHQESCDEETTEQRISTGSSNEPGSTGNSAISTKTSSEEGERRIQSSKLPGIVFVANSRGELIGTEMHDHDENEVSLDEVAPAFATSWRNNRVELLKKLEIQVQQTLGTDEASRRMTRNYFLGLAAFSGLIVSFNITRHSSEAIIVYHNGIQALRFNINEEDGLDYDNVRKHTDEAMGPDSFLKERLDSPDYLTRNSRLQTLLKWLWKAAVKPVFKECRILHHDNIGNTDLIPRVTWVTSGLLGNLPLHAAGDNSLGPHENTYSHVVSSYVPTFRALEFAQERWQNRQRSGRSVLSVSMPETAGMPDLAVGGAVEGLKAEVDAASTIADKSVHLDQPSKHAVVKALREASHVHFACHGIADAESPSASAICLKETAAGKPGRLTVEDLARLHLPNVELAYLSACSTAENASLDLVSESLHMAAACQMVGFPNVIGTLWEAQHYAAASVAKQFYAEVAARQARDDEDPGIYAKALHAATAHLRDMVGSGSKKQKEKARVNALAWAPFVHLGC